jgi:hypothetical protein
MTTYGLNENMRLIPDDQGASAPPAILAVAPSTARHSAGGRSDGRAIA